ncbi:MAG: helix-turn-helix domain-containing protein [Chloroflexi bacterium]|nr:helix-turn-helix domain-containing protein [Chloroflexota bacterium]
MSKSSQGTDWLTLTEASALLGIHPITLRSWADAGLVRLFRTPGGHRRFRREELLAFMEERLPAPARTMVPAQDQTLANIRSELGSSPIRQAAWYTKLSDEQRVLHRELGQRLLGLLLQFVSRQENANEFLEQARELSRQYGLELAHAQLGSGELARAFLFFRRVIINATYHPAGTSAQADADGVRLLERINAFMDELLIAALDHYDEITLRLQTAASSASTVQTVSAPKRKTRAARTPRHTTRAPHPRRK